jgi:soluble lytic murein transglycosylase-like protein
MSLNNFKFLNEIRTVAVAVGLAATLSASDASVPKPMKDAVARQHQALAAMAESLQAQRRSVQLQLSALPEASFFKLSPLPPAPPIPPLPAATPTCPQLPSSELDALIDGAAQRQDLEPDLLRSVIRQESAARPCAVSPKGAMGLMQLMPATAVQLGVVNAFDPKENIDGGARLLKQLLKAYGGDVSLALGAFNAGPGKVDEAGGLPDYPETLDYVQRVMSFLPSAH